MSARTKARKRALDILFAADVRGEEAANLLKAEGERAELEPDRRASWMYAREIVLGVLDNREHIDELISTSSRDWPLERMPAVDRALLRIAVWEMRFNPEVPPAVAIDQAIEAAKEFSTEDSSRFVHGVLGRISDM